MGRREAMTACRERLFAIAGRLHGCRQPHDPLSSPGSGRCHDRLALAGLDHHEARAVESQLEGFARAAPNEGAHLEGVLDLRLQVRRPADRCLRVNEGRLLRAVQKHRRTVGGRGLCLFSGGVWLSSVAVGARLHDRVSYTKLPWASIFSTDVV